MTKDVLEELDREFKPTQKEVKEQKKADKFNAVGIECQCLGSIGWLVVVQFDRLVVDGSCSVWIKVRDGLLPV